MSTTAGAGNLNYGGAGGGPLVFYVPEKTCGTSKCGRPCHKGINIQILKVTKSTKPMECKAWCRKCEVFIEGIQVESCDEHE